MPKIVGWTSVEPRNERTLTVASRAALPFVQSHRAGSRRKISPRTEIVQHTFTVRTVYRGVPARVIMLGPNDDPTVLPMWRKCWDYPLPPTIFDPEVIFRRRDQPTGPQYLIVMVGQFDFEARRDTTVGLPIMACADGEGGLWVWPEPSDEYEIVPSPNDRRIYSFEPPDTRPYVFPTQEAFTGNALRGEEITATFLNEVASVPPEFFTGHALRNLTAGIVRAAVANYGATPAAIRAAPDTIAALTRDFVRGPRRHDQLADMTVMGIPVRADPFVPPGQAYVIGADPARWRDPTFARMRPGQITAVDVVNAGAGYTRAPGINLYDELAAVTRRAFVPNIEVGIYNAHPLFGFPQVDHETAQRSRERARGLLKSLLTPQQWAEFETSGAVSERIDGCDFKLRPGQMIEARKPRIIGSVKERWCVNPEPYTVGEDWMPAEDKLIGQLLHLRAGPEKLRASANVFPG